MKENCGKVLEKVFKAVLTRLDFFRKKLQVGLVLLGQAFFLAGITIFSVMPTGCKLEEDNSELLSGDHSAPVIEDVKVVDENTVEIEFSEPVKVETESVTEIGKKEDGLEDEKKSDSELDSDGREEASKDSITDDSVEKEVEDELIGELEKNDSEVLDKESPEVQDVPEIPTEVEEPIGVEDSIDEPLEKKDESNGETEKSEADSNDEKEETGKSEISYSDDGAKVTITLPEETEPGKDYVISGTVEDEKGNTLTFAIPFTGYNGNLPKLVMTEIQTESLGQSASEKKNGTYRNEFVEFLALSEGNLAGFELVSVYDGEEKKYVFPSCDVKAGEVFVVHLRNRGEGCISETGDDLNVAFGGYAKDGIRDLWAASETTALGNATDVILLRNSADGSIWDAVMFRDAKVAEWSEKYIQYVEKLVQIGFYSGVEVENATFTEGMTASKTLSRKNAYELLQYALTGENIAYPIAVAAEDWIITAVSCGEVME